MRILYISGSSAQGGAQLALWNLASGLVAAGHEIGVVLPDKKGLYYKKFTDIGVTVFADEPYVLTIKPQCVMPWKRSRRRKMVERNKHEVREYIGGILDSFKPDIVHTNVGPLDIAPFECAKRDIPHVWHIREYQDKGFGMKFYPDKKSFKFQLGTKGNHCISITNALFKYWELDPERDRVIYDGVVEDKVCELPERDVVEPFFLYAGRIEKGRSLKSLLKAYRKYVKGGGEIKLQVAGRPCGFYAFRCKLYAKVWIGKGRVKFLGHVEDVKERMARATAVIVPCKWEGFGFTAVEAMSVGCPVIGRDNAGMREQMEKGLKYSGGPIALPYKKKSELVAHLQSFRDAEQSVSEMTVRAKSTVRNLYSTSRCVAETEGFYKSLLERA